MNAKILNIDESQTKATRHFDYIDGDLALLRIQFDNHDNAPYHFFWRDGVKLPLDMAVDRINGAICYIKYYFKQENLAITNDSVFKLPFHAGLPRFYTEEFSIKKYKAENKCTFLHYRNNSAVAVCFKDSAPALSYDVDKNFAILADKNSCFVGFILRNLTETEKEKLQKTNILV